MTIPMNQPAGADEPRAGDSERRVRAALQSIPPGAPLLAVVGPTASGKSDWGVSLSRAFGGEVISADSRQVYVGLDIGTGKVEGALDSTRARRAQVLGQDFLSAPFVSEGVDHWLMDIASPETVVTAAQYQLLAYGAMAEILERGHIPILVGGTGLYVHAVVDGLVMPSVEPDPELRARLEGTDTATLRDELLRVDPTAGDVVDLANPRRMVRALEVARAAGTVRAARGRVPVPFRSLLLGVRLARATLLDRIHRRLWMRHEQGLVEEVEGLAARGLSYERMEDLGLEYRYVSRYLRGVYTREEMLEELERAIARFARRQMTWFRKRGPVEWVDSVDEAVQRARDFLK